MNKLEFPLLKAEQIEIRVATVSEKGCSLLLYKDARCDMNILDETVGAYNWKRTHNRENANCIVSIWDESKGEWIEKEDTGSKSYTEEEKGLASDSFKRACYNWGIGRELYTAPFIWVAADKVNLTPKGGKFTTYDKFNVSKIEYTHKIITNLEIKNQKSNVIVYSMKSHTNTAPKQEYKCEDCGKPFEPFTYKGYNYNAKTAHEWSAKRYGRALCSGCAKKQSQVNKTETA